MKMRNKTLVPRNPYAVAAAQKMAGKHEKTNKAKRQQTKQALQKELETMKDKEKGGNHPPFILPHLPSNALKIRPKLNHPSVQLKLHKTWSFFSTL